MPSSSGGRSCERFEEHIVTRARSRLANRERRKNMSDKSMGFIGGGRVTRNVMAGLNGLEPCLIGLSSVTGLPKY